MPAEPALAVGAIPRSAAPKIAFRAVQGIMRPVGAVFSDDPLIFQGDAPKASRGLREIAFGVFFFFFWLNHWYSFGFDHAHMKN